MLNKELLIGNTGGQQPVALTVGRKRQGTSVPRIYEYGYDRLDFGELAPDLFWGNDIRLNSLKCYNGYYTTCHVSNSSFIVTVYVSGYHDSPIRSEGNIDGDIFELKEKVGQTVYLTFDPPRWVLGSKDARTNLRRGYYVEGKVPWEAQNAEQGASYGCR